MNQASTVDQAVWITEPYSAILEPSTGNVARAGYLQEQVRTATAAFLGSKILPMLFEPQCDRITILELRVRKKPQMRETFKAGAAGTVRGATEKSVRTAYCRT